MQCPVESAEDRQRQQQGPGLKPVAAFSRSTLSSTLGLLPLLHLVPHLINFCQLVTRQGWIPVSPLPILPTRPTATLAMLRLMTLRSLPPTLRTRRATVFPPLPQRQQHRPPQRRRQQQQLLTLPLILRVAYPNTSRLAPASPIPSLLHHRARPPTIPSHLEHLPLPS